jgi:hypothetical protein
MFDPAVNRSFKGRWEAGTAACGAAHIRRGWRRSRGNLSNGFGGLGEGFPVGHRAVGLVGFPCGADGGVEGGPLLRFVLGFVQALDTPPGVKGRWPMARRRWA